VGTLEQVLSFKVGFDTTIPERLGLPLIKPNKAEGIVIKPYDVVELNLGHRYLRPTLKIKIDTFKEDKKYHQAKKWKRHHRYRGVGQFQDSALHSLEMLLLRSSDLMNKYRLDSAVSKLGRRTAFEDLEIEIVTDVLESLGREFNLLSIDTRANGQLREVLKKQAHNLVFQHGFRPKSKQGLK